MSNGGMGTLHKHTHLVNPKYHRPTFLLLSLSIYCSTFNSRTNLDDDVTFLHFSAIIQIFTGFKILLPDLSCKYH